MNILFEALTFPRIPDTSEVLSARVQDFSPLPPCRDRVFDGYGVQRIWDE
jgi:hypothetical protein